MGTIHKDEPLQVTSNPLFNQNLEITELHATTALNGDNPNAATGRGANHLHHHTTPPPPPIPEEDGWKVCQIGNVPRRIDLKVIEPYKKVLSHGGYNGCQAVIVFSACYLPDRSRMDYHYVMDHLFLYVVSSLEELVDDDYALIYLHGATDKGNMPSFSWLKRCYQMIDRRLRKNLKELYLVHPTFWLRTLVFMTKPFVSSKFSKKLKFVNDLNELSTFIPIDHICIPDRVKKLESEMSADPKSSQHPTAE